jgi:S-adenosylmethionine decarboxylase
MHDLAPEVPRQRLLVEGYYTANVDEERVEAYLQGVAAHLGLRTYGRPAIFAPAGEGRSENQGFDAFLPLIDSGISLYVWTGPRFIAAVLFTCKLFDERSAIEYTSEFFKLSEFKAHAF